MKYEQNHKKRHVNPIKQTDSDSDISSKDYLYDVNSKKNQMFV